MERKGWVLGALALVAILAVVALTWGGGADPEPPEDARIGAAGAAGASVTGGADGRSSDDAIAHAERGRGFDGDAGLHPRAAAPSSSAPSPEPTRPENARGELRRGDLGAGESAGWRLGQTRGRIELVQPRIARMQQIASELEARGETEAAERQRVVLRRFETRLEELRAEEAELAAEAQREGTLDEVEVGMREGVSPNQLERPAVRINPR